jgi:hypothetical protein
MSDGANGAGASGGAVGANGAGPASNGAAGNQGAGQAGSARPSQNGGAGRSPDGRFQGSNAGSGQGAAVTAGANAGQKPGDVEAAAAAKAAKEAYRIKGKINVYGKEEDVELTEEDALRNTQLRKAYEKKLQQFEDRARKAQRILELAESDPDEFYRQLGKDPDKIAEEKMIRRAQMAQMTDEQRAIAERDEKLRQYEERDKQRATQEKQQAMNQRQEMLIERYKQEFAQVAEQHGFEKTWDDLYRYADAREMLLKKTRGVAPTPAEIAAVAKKGLDRDVDRSIGALDGEALLRRLGPKALDKITKAVLARHQQTHGAAPVQQAAAAQEPERRQEYITDAELNKRMRDAIHGGK